jgi:biotin carboxyl carrier protein
VEVEVQGTIYRLDVRRDGHEWVVNLDGRTCRVDARRLAGSWSLLIGPDAAAPRSARRSYDVAFESSSDGLGVHVDGVAVPVSFPGSHRRRPRQAAAASAGGARYAALAPMPGRVVKVLVAAGDVVADRQPLVVLEAMKMQNDVRAARAGRVSEIRAVEGSLVDAGTVLVVVDAETPSGS